jgi:hypothetical protein
VNAARDVARVLAAGRAALGAGCVLAPGLAARASLGAEGRRPGAQVFARGLGVRDAVIGGIALHTLDHPQVGPRWQATCALIDAVDLTAVVVARRGLPRRTLVGAVALAGGAVLAEAWAVRALRVAGEGAPQEITAPVPA